MFHSGRVTPDPMVAAAPELVSVMRSLRHDIDRIVGTYSMTPEFRSELRVMLGSVDAVLRKAEPPRKRHVWVTMAVDVGADVVEDLDADHVVEAIAIQMVRDGGGEVIKTVFVE